MSRLADRLTRARADYRQAARVLRRARILYVRFAREAILRDETHLTLTTCAGGMIEAGLYAPGTELRLARYSILRHMFRQDGSPGCWHRWYMERGFAGYTWFKEERKLA